MDISFINVVFKYQRSSRISSNTFERTATDDLEVLINSELKNLDIGDLNHRLVKNLNLFQFLFICLSDFIMMIEDIFPSI
jgi:hypothetical protein